MLVKNLSVLLLFGFSTLSFGFDIIGKDDRRELTTEELNSHSFVGRLHVNTLTQWQGWQDIPRCSVTLVSEKTAITDASCFVSTSLIAREEVAKLKTKDDYVSHFINNREDYSVVFSSPKYKRISIRSIHFAPNFNPGQVSRDTSRYTHIFFVSPPMGNPLLVLDLETNPEIEPVTPYKWENEHSLKDDVTTSTISHGRDNSTLLITPNCTTTDDFEDKSGMDMGSIFQNTCDDVSMNGSPVLLNTPSGYHVLRGLTVSGQQLSDITSKHPDLDQYSIFDLQDKSCGDLSPNCVNVAITGTSILNRLEEIFPVTDFLDELNEAQKKTCAAKLVYNHLVLHSSQEELYKLCPRSEILTTESSLKDLRLERIEKLEGLKDLKLKETLASLQRKAQVEEAVLKGNAIPENFVLSDSFFKEVVNSNAFDTFKNLKEKNLLSNNQMLNFMENSSGSLDQQYALYGKDQFTKNLLALAGRNSPLFSQTALWKVLAENKVSPQSITNLSVRNLLQNFKVPLETLKSFYTIQDFKKEYSYQNLVSIAHFSKKELVASGISYKEFIYTFSAKELKDNGGDLSKFKSSDVSIYDLIRGDFSAAELKTTGFSLDEVLQAASPKMARDLGYSLSDLKKSSATIRQLEWIFSQPEIRKVFTLAELAQRGTEMERLKKDYAMTSAEGQKSFPLDSLYPVYSLPELLEGGSSTADLRALYCKLIPGICSGDRKSYYGASLSFLAQLGRTNITAEALQQVGFTPMEIFKARNDLKVIKSLNKTILEYYSNGFSPAQLVDMGFEKKLIKKELKAAGYKIKNSDFKN